MTSIEPPKSNTNPLGKQEYVFDDKDFLYTVAREIINRILQGEMTDFLHAAPEERTENRTGYRSGYRQRSMKTRVGRLWFDVPCERSGRFKTKVFRRYQRTEQAFLLTIQEMYVNGVSTRKVRKLTEELCDTTLSASTVSRLNVELDKILEPWRQRKLTEPYLALIVDARYESVRTNGHVVSQGVLTVAGVSSQTGRREMLGVYLAQSENQTSWGDVFRDLLQRGLRGVRMVTSDSHQGIRAAMAQYFQGIPWQRCTRHFNVNARDMVRKDEQTALGIDLNSIFDAPSLEHARRRLAEVLDKWRPGHEKLTDWLEANIEECLSFFQFPETYRVKLRTTNMIERENEELKRRSVVVGIFPNPEACLRLMTALTIDRSDGWAENGAYLNLKELRAWDEAKTVPQLPKPQDPAGLLH